MLYTRMWAIISMESQLRSDTKCIKYLLIITKEGTLKTSWLSRCSTVLVLYNYPSKAISFLTANMLAITHNQTSASNRNSVQNRPLKRNLLWCVLSESFTSFLIRIIEGSSESFGQRVNLGHAVIMPKNVHFRHNLIFLENLDQINH